MKKLILFVLIAIYISSLTPLISSEEIPDPTLLCLEKGEKLEFSLCNPAIEDRTCNDTLGCQYCVTEVRDGVYCPRNINDCNYAKLSCTYSDGTSEENNQNDNNEEDNQDNTNKETGGNSIFKGITVSNSDSKNDDNDDNSYDEDENEETEDDISNSFVLEGKKSKSKIPFAFLSLVTLFEVICLSGLLYYSSKKKHFS